MTISITSSELFQRQITLLGTEGQKLVGQARILIVGAGGLGCPALQYLSATGVGEIGVLDFDKISVSNLQRQILFRPEDVGHLKVKVATERLRKHAPFTKFLDLPIALNEDNAASVISNYDVILDCTDNFHTKFLLHDFCFQEKKVLIQASVYQYEGQLQVFDFRNQQGPCWRCLWEIPPEDGCTGTCAEVGVIGPLLGVMGSLQAMEALKVILGKPFLENGNSLFIDLLTLSMEPRGFKVRKDCSCCVKKDLPQTEGIQVSLPARLNEFIILDVRSQKENQDCPVLKDLSVAEVINVPLEDVNSFIPLASKKYLVVCTKGIRSLKACRILRKDHREVYSLLGGIETLAEES